MVLVAESSVQSRTRVIQMGDMHIKTLTYLGATEVAVQRIDLDETENGRGINNCSLTTLLPYCCSSTPRHLPK